VQSGTESPHHTQPTVEIFPAQDAVAVLESDSEQPFVQIHDNDASWFISVKKRPFQLRKV
jgi:hypothetical protein